MTARRCYVLQCDAPLCQQSFYGKALDAGAVRLEARALKWTAKKVSRTVEAPNGLREFVCINDFCPEHLNGFISAKRKGRA